MSLPQRRADTAWFLTLASPNPSHLLALHKGGRDRTTGKVGRAQRPNTTTLLRCEAMHQRSTVKGIWWFPAKPDSLRLI